MGYEIKLMSRFVLPTLRTGFFLVLNTDPINLQTHSHSLLHLSVICIPCGFATRPTRIFPLK
jgi:hypothetical protein